MRYLIINFTTKHNWAGQGGLAGLGKKVRQLPEFTVPHEIWGLKTQTCERDVKSTSL